MLFQYYCTTKFLIHLIQKKIFLSVCFVSKFCKLAYFSCIRIEFCCIYDMTEYGHVLEEGKGYCYTGENRMNPHLEVVSRVRVTLR